MVDARFPGPRDVHPPDGATQWRRLYNWYHVFDAEPSADDERFWFQDALHHPRVMRPYDEIQSECWWQALGAFNTRIFAVPPAYGVDQRILNGYLYVSPVSAPEADLEARSAEFAERAGHYYEHWDTIYEEWKQKVRSALDRIRAVRFAPLPDIEDRAVVDGHVGLSSGYRMIADYDALVLTMYETYQYHFEMLNIGYAAYLTFFDFMRESFPDIEEQSIATMVTGLWVDLYRPDEELKRLAKRAVDDGLAELILGEPDVDAVFAALRAHPAGEEWVLDWERTADPWFVINTDVGHPGGYSDSRTLADQPALPMESVRVYIRALRRGEVVDRPTKEIVEQRDAVTREYRELLSPDRVDRFDALLELARKVFVYIEEHVLYIEHWMWATFWSKSRELAAALVAMGALDDEDDVFYLRRTEVAETIYDVVAAWSVGRGRGRSAAHWRPVVGERRAIVEALRTRPAPAALGTPPATVNEPLTKMLWGISSETIERWRHGRDDDQVITGRAGSPGVAEGTARVVTETAGLSEIREGEILVCPATSPSWSPVFARIAATVSDIGGIMSHTAIVCREYGLPAVVGTGDACSSITTGQRIRVDGSLGTVTVLSGAGE